MPDTPIISACICSHNGAQRIEESLWSLLGQSAPAGDYEVLVVDNASSDTEEIRARVRGFVEQGYAIRLVHEPQLGLAHAKNRAVRESRADYIYFLDDDAVANPRLIESYLQAILEYKPDVMGGHVHPLFDRLPPAELDYSQWSMWSLRHFCAQASGSQGAGSQGRWLDDGEYFLGGNLCVARAVLERHPHDPALGRRGDELRGGEEWYLGAAEFRRRLVPGGFIFHHVPQERTSMEYVLRVMCGPTAPLSQLSPQQDIRQPRPGGYLARAWSREIALSLRRIVFQLRLALASRRSSSVAATGPSARDAKCFRVLNLLKRENPLFQLRTGNAELPSSERLFAEHGGAETRRFARASAALPPDSLAAVHRLLKPRHCTLEIGGGHSTVAFASVVEKHICINPDRTANQLVREFLEQHGLWRDNVEFLGESSDDALPGLEIPAGIDVALMDGNHSFPFPMLDWHFIDRHLRRGSFLVIDNVEINAVRMLTEYLDREPAYRLIERVRGSHRYDCYIYEKIRDSVVSGWSDQGLNRSPLATLCFDATQTALWKPLQRIKRRLFSS